MPKATKKKKPIGKAVAAVLKATQNMVFETADLDVQLRQMREILGPAGGSVGIGTITYAGRTYYGSGVVQIHVNNYFASSDWPEWAYGVAADAVRFGKQVIVAYNTDVPWGANMLTIFLIG